MNDPGGGQIESGSQAGFAGWTAVELATGLEELWSGCGVDGAVNTSSTEQAVVGSIDDCVELQLSDIRPDDFNHVHTLIMQIRIPDK
jgi:hypothetical protein